MVSNDPPHGTGGDDDQDRSGTERYKSAPASPDRSEIFRRYQELERVQEKLDDLESLLSRGGFIPSNEHDQREFGDRMAWVRQSMERDERDKAAHQKIVDRRTKFFAWAGGMMAAGIFSLFLPDWWQAIERGWQALRKYFP